MVYVPDDKSPINGAAIQMHSEQGHDDPTTNPNALQSLPSELLLLLDSIATLLIESCETDVITDETTFLGRNASATFFRCVSLAHPSGLLPSHISVESAFALSNRTTLHPFGSLWHTVDVTLAEVLRALPGSETCLR